MPGISLLLRVERLDNGSLVAAVERAGPAQPPDDRGALFYVLVVILVYGCSIVMIIASYTRKNSADRKLSNYLAEMMNVRRRMLQFPIVTAAPAATATALSAPAPTVIASSAPIPTVTASTTAAPDDGGAAVVGADDDDVFDNCSAHVTFVNESRDDDVTDADSLATLDDDSVAGINSAYNYNYNIIADVSSDHDATWSSRLCP